MNISQRELEKQFARIKNEGWLPFFRKAARVARTTTAHVLAIGSRETNLKNIRGDFRNGKWNGFGIMQVDIGTDPDYCRTWTPAAVEIGILRGAEILADKRGQVENGVGKKINVRGKTFRGRETEPDDVRRISTAAYNCGLWAYYHFSRGEHIDSTTTGDDYSRDVYDRAVAFARLLQLDGEREAERNEVLLQGKYARAADLERIAAPVHLRKESLPFGEPLDDDENVARVTYRADDNEANIGEGVAAGPEGNENYVQTTSSETLGNGVHVENKIEVQPGNPATAQPGAEFTGGAAIVPPLVAEKPTPEVTVSQIAPVTETATSVFSKLETLQTHFKAWKLLVPSGITGFFYAVYQSLTGGNLWIILLVLALVGIMLTSYGLAVMWLKNQDRKRADENELRNHELQMQRERQAHELTVFQAQTAALQSQFTVRVQPTTTNRQPPLN